VNLYSAYHFKKTSNALEVHNSTTMSSTPRQRYFVHEVLTRNQSNLAKAASNALHTTRVGLYNYSLPKICRGSQKLKIGHVIQTQTRQSFVCTQNFKSLTSAVLEIRRGFPQFRIRSRDFAHTPYGLFCIVLVKNPYLYMHA